ncbi:MAG: mandelate racemase, partial [Candidatus Latescibacteria bacterium]|nr:mandelate racemase [Candidatus Latescibacterota bacterium]
MKITQVERFVTAVPHIPSIEKSRPGDYKERPITIIRVHTDEGIVGIGEGGRGDLMEGVEQAWV